jgi:hypothetical protein
MDFILLLLALFIIIFVILVMYNYTIIQIVAVYFIVVTHSPIFVYPIQIGIVL